MNPILKRKLIQRAKKKGLDEQQAEEYIRLMLREIAWMRRNTGKKD